MSKESSPFVLKQLEEALEERQVSDRRKEDDKSAWPESSDRRTNDRRKTAKASTR